MYTIGIKDFKKRQFDTKQELCNYLAQYMKNVPYGARIFKILRDGEMYPTNYIVGDCCGNCFPMRKNMTTAEVNILKMIKR